MMIELLTSDGMITSGMPVLSPTPSARIGNAEVENPNPVAPLTKAATK